MILHTIFFLKLDSRRWDMSADVIITSCMTISKEDVVQIVITMSSYTLHRLFYAEYTISFSKLITCFIVITSVVTSVMDDCRCASDPNGWT